MINYEEIMPERVERLLAEIREWCGQARGRQNRLAEVLGVKRQAITAWFNPKEGKSRKLPTGEQVLMIQEFLEEQRKNQ